jgi:transposase
MGEKNRHFSREFKRDAVQLVTEKGMSVGKVARELDIHPNLLHLRIRSLFFHPLSASTLWISTKYVTF